MPVPKFVCCVPLAALVLSLSGCLDPCENAVRTELVSPDQTKRVVVFERSCGATTPFSTRMSVLDRGAALPHSAGNVFDADSDHGAVKDVKVTVQWLSPQQLVIRYPARARVFNSMPGINGVAIAYEPTP